MILFRSVVLSLAAFTVSSAYAQSGVDCRSATSPVIEIQSGCAVPSDLSQPKLSDKISAVFWVKMPNNVSSCFMNATGDSTQPYDFLKAYSRESNPNPSRPYQVISSVATQLSSDPIAFICVQNIGRDQAYPQGVFRSTVQTLHLNGNVDWTGNSDINPESYNSNPSSGDLGTQGNSKLCGVAQVPGTGMTYDDYAQLYYGKTFEQLCPAEANDALPVELVSWKASVSGGVVQLSWTTGVEAAFSGFEVERSRDAISFSSLARIDAKGSGSQYSYNDGAVTGKAYYRLAMIDRDGSTRYSKVVSAEVAASASDSVTLYPNPVPAGASAKLSVTSLQGGTAQVLIYTTAGRTVSSRAINLTEGSQTVVLSETGKLAAGAYFGVLRTNNGDRRFRFLVR